MPLHRNDVRVGRNVLRKVYNLCRGAIAPIEFHDIALRKNLFDRFSGRRAIRIHGLRYIAQHRLLAFENMERISDKSDYAYLDLAFATLEDSVFWDSRSNFYDAFYLELQPMKNDMLRKELIEAAESDSFCLLVSPAHFFNERRARRFDSRARQDRACHVAHDTRDCLCA